MYIGKKVFCSAAICRDHYVRLCRRYNYLQMHGEMPNFAPTVDAEVEALLKHMNCLSKRVQVAEVELAIACGQTERHLSCKRCVESSGMPRAHKINQRLSLIHI